MRVVEFYETESGSCPIAEYLNKLNQKQVEKILWTLDLIRELETVSTEYLKKLKHTEDIWEVRDQFGNNIFRLLGFFENKSLIILNHAFTKKTQKTPKKEIKLAEKRKREYYQRRKQ